MLVASFEMPERAGISSTSKPASSSTRTTFAHSGSDRADSRSKSSVYSRRARARRTHRCRVATSTHASWPARGSRTIPFAPPTIGRYSGSSRSVPSTMPRSALSSSSISPAPKRPLHRASISSKSVGQIASAFRPFRRGSHDPGALQSTRAPEAVALRGGPAADGDVSPSLHASHRREHSRLRKPGGARKLTDGDPVTDEPQEVRPHHERDDPRRTACLREPMLELVVELDRVRDQRLREQGRQRSIRLDGTLLDVFLPVVEHCGSVHESGLEKADARTRTGDPFITRHDRAMTTREVA